MSDYETIRAANIARNRALIADLGIKSISSPPLKRKRDEQANGTKRRIKKDPEFAVRPTRTSVRIASAPIKPSYTSEATIEKTPTVRSKKNGIRSARDKLSALTADELSQTDDTSSKRENIDLPSLRASWSSWTATAPPPTRGTPFGEFHFPSHPDFTPNKSPAEMLREGVFGGSYFRPLYSRALDTTIADDWRELPSEWLEGVNTERYLTQSGYDATINKFGERAAQYRGTRRRWHD